MQTCQKSNLKIDTTDLSQWNPEDQQQWESFGKKVAFRNLWVSVPCLLCGFAVWMYWGVITVQMLNLGFPYTKAQLFTLMAIAGLSGATLRIPSTFLIRMAGGRNTIFFTTLLLILPAFGTGIALSSKDTPLFVFQLLALLSGFGGGNFASSMSNISYFFSKENARSFIGLKCRSWKLRSHHYANFGTAGDDIFSSWAEFYGP